LSYILGIVAVVLFFVVLHYTTELDKKQKISITLAIFTIVSGAVFYNDYSNKERDRIIELELKYNQNKNLHCDGVDVNRSDFEYSSGTQVFIGKKNTPHSNRIISITQCQ
jgi:hypothetical protein